MLQLIKIRCGHTHSAKASLQSPGFHGKLITIIRPLITSSSSIRQRNLLFVTFVLLSHPLCRNKPPKRLRPGLWLRLAPFHHNYTAEQNQAPALERAHQTSNCCFTNGCKSLLHFLKELSDLPEFHSTSICQKSTFLFYSCYVPPFWQIFHTTWRSPKAKTPSKQKSEDRAALSWTSREKVSVLHGLSPWRISSLYPFLSADSTRAILCLPVWRTGVSSC